MFTGLVQAMGTIVAQEAREGGGLRLRIRAGELAREAAIGDSVAVNGCCLTVVESPGEELAFDVIPESLDRTSLGSRDTVNLELPLRPTDRLGGHFVQGHVDGVAELLERRADGDDVVMRFSLPEALRGQIVEKGSIAVDGVSLTVAAVDDRSFSVALIPHTLEVTTLGALALGERVNLEGDILAKYVASLLGNR